MTKSLPANLDAPSVQAQIDLVPHPVYVVDVSTLNLMATNRHMRKRMLTQDADVPCHKAIYQLDLPCSFCRIHELQREDNTAGEVTFEHFNDADERWYQLQESLVEWFDGRAAKYSMGVDISRHKDTQNALTAAQDRISLQGQQLAKISHTDRLTGLFNRRRLDEALAFEIERSARYGQPFSVVLADVDKFQSVNEEHGHQAGDTVLVAMADAFGQGVRKSDLLARWGGEEFLVLCSNTDLAGAATMAENLRQLVQAEELAVVGHKTCSFGVAQWTKDESVASLVARADAALFLAKANGRNRVELG